MGQADEPSHPHTIVLFVFLAAVAQGVIMYVASIYPTMYNVHATILRLQCILQYADANCFIIIMLAPYCFVQYHQDVMSDLKP